MLQATRLQSSGLVQSFFRSGFILSVRSRRSEDFVAKPKKKMSNKCKSYCCM
nr:MAG TPA: hypothetical protein [Caudoviricetes sp.]